MSALASRRFISIGRGDNHRALIYVGDVARAIVMALESPSAGGRVFNVCDSHSYSLRQIIDAICHALGRRPPVVRLPIAVASAGARIVEAAADLVGWPAPIDRQTIRKYLEHIVVSGARAERELGFTPATSLEEGWCKTVSAMRASGTLPQGRDSRSAPAGPAS